MAFNRYDILTAHYKKQIADWNWDQLRKDAANNIHEDYDGERRAETYLGSILCLAPSGKCYAPWTTNQTRSDVVKDGCFFDALDCIALASGMYVTGSEGDGCDIMVGLIDVPESDD